MKQNFHLLAKPTGAACNLNCKYCFFLSKENLYEENESPLMDEDTLDVYIRQLVLTSASPEIQITWQGGEPMLRGLDFFRRSVELANRYRKPHQHIFHAIQTNGTLIDDSWAAFFKQYNYLVGLSIDGPRNLHDAYRVGTNGQGSFDAVIRGWNCLRNHGVDVNILCTIHTANADYPLDVYHFFRDDLKAQYIHLIPIVERATEDTITLANQGWDRTGANTRPLYRQVGALVTERMVTAEKFGQFLIAIFDEWVKQDIGSIFVTTFDIALGSWLGQHNACISAPTCGSALVLEHNGDVYSCDHFVEPEYRLGNIREKSLKTLLNSKKQHHFGQNKYDTLPQYCRECPVLFACYGECPRNRFIKTPDCEDGLNYLCAGYRSFFAHIDGPMKTMADLLRQGRFADEIMTSKTDGHA